MRVAYTGALTFIGVYSKAYSIIVIVFLSERSIKDKMMISVQINASLIRMKRHHNANRELWTSETRSVGPVDFLDALTCFRVR